MNLKQERAHCWGWVSSCSPHKAQALWPHQNPEPRQGVGACLCERESLGGSMTWSWTQWELGLEDWRCCGCWEWGYRGLAVGKVAMPVDRWEHRPHEQRGKRGRPRMAAMAVRDRARVARSQRLGGEGAATEVRGRERCDRDTAARTPPCVRGRHSPEGKGTLLGAGTGVRRSRARAAPRWGWKRGRDRRGPGAGRRGGCSWGARRSWGLPAPRQEPQGSLHIPDPCMATSRRKRGREGEKRTAALASEKQPPPPRPASCEPQVVATDWQPSPSSWHCHWVLFTPISNVCGGALALIGGPFPAPPGTEKKGGEGAGLEAEGAGRRRGRGGLAREGGRRRLERSSGGGAGWGGARCQVGAGQRGVGGDDAQGVRSLSWEPGGRREGRWGGPAAF